MRRSAIDLIGKEFGKIKVVGLIKQENKPGWRLQCHCGYCGNQNAIIHPWRLQQGLVKSCGCQCPKHKEVIGLRFGYLEILSEFRKKKINTNKYSYYLLCKCHNCGNDKFETIKQSVLKGRTTSCGCSKDRYVKTTGKKSKQFTGYEDISGRHWSQITGRAKRRGYEITISIQEAWDIFKKQECKCALTGLPLNLRGNEHISASLDRIDSKRGYVKDNLQWVLKSVNIMKNTYPVEYFVNICRCIAAQSPGIPTLSVNEMINLGWNNHTKLENIS